VYEALNKLIKSGIPGLEGLFSADGGAGNLFSKMSDEDKKRFLAAVTGAGEGPPSIVLIFEIFSPKMS
jgi:hypothetical protein